MNIKNHFLVLQCILKLNEMFVPYCKNAAKVLYDLALVTLEMAFTMYFVRNSSTVDWFWVKNIIEYNKKVAYFTTFHGLS